jgi:hypothetical protein
MALLLYFMIGAGSHLVSIDGSEEPIDDHHYALTSEEVLALGIDSDVLTRDHVTELLMNDGTGLLHLLSNPKSGRQADERLHQLWTTLIPEKQRSATLAGKYKRLIIIPDGHLALLPFETLVVEPGETPKYLIDVGPSIHYAPSPTILYRLAHRQTEGVTPAAQPVLTVGDPAYGLASAPDQDTRRSARWGRVLNRLPYSGQEATWVAEVFKNNGSAAAILK